MINNRKRKQRFDPVEMTIHLTFGSAVLLELTFLAFHLGLLP